MANIEKLEPINAMDYAVGQMAGEMARMLQHVGQLGPLGLQRFVESLEVVLEAAKAERAKRVVAAGGELEVGPGEVLRQVVCGDKQPNMKRFGPMLSAKGISLESACFSQIEWFADPVKLSNLINAGRITQEDVNRCKRTWTQIRKIKKGQDLNEDPGDVD